jgi:hypothetical protein
MQLLYSDSTKTMRSNIATVTCLASEVLPLSHGAQQAQVHQAGQQVLLGLPQLVHALKRQPVVLAEPETQINKNIACVSKRFI